MQCADIDQKDKRGGVRQLVLSSGGQETPRNCRGIEAGWAHFGKITEQMKMQT